MVRRDILEFAVLGVLADGPIHGYELRKRLTEMLGPFRSLSYGTLYPTLRRLVNRHAIEPVSLTPHQDSPGMRTKRARIVYALTAEGKEEFEQWANKVWNFGSGLGAEVSLKDFRKDLIIEVYNEAGQLVDGPLGRGQGVEQHGAIDRMASCALLPDRQEAFRADAEHGLRPVR